MPRDGAWLNSQESLSLSLPLSNSGLDAYTLWLLTGIAHCHAHHSLQAQQRIATPAAALSLSLSPALSTSTRQDSSSPSLCDSLSPAYDLYFTSSQLKQEITTRYIQVGIHISLSEVAGVRMLLVCFVLDAILKETCTGLE